MSSDEPLAEQPTPGGDAAASDETADEQAEVAETDDLRQEQVARIGEHLGDALLAHHIVPGRDLWIRVDPAQWRRTGEVLRDEIGCGYFDFLSAIDWLPSPFGRDMDSQEDRQVAGEADDGAESTEIEHGVTGGETRFQVLARVHSTAEGFGIFVKADLADERPAIETWVPVYAGANWHEREAAEMFGIEFIGHPYPVKLYLPGAFEGHPLRKDFPLLSRRVKPWPGIVDVEAMPGDGEDDESAAGDVASEPAATGGES